MQRAYAACELYSLSNLTESGVCLCQYIVVCAYVKGSRKVYAIKRRNKLARYKAVVVTW